jgi:GTP cyclohydrolase I
MKLQETMLNTQVNGKKKVNGIEHNGDAVLTDYDSEGNDHDWYSLDTPMRPGAFAISDAEKIEMISEKFADIMHILGMNLKDDSLKGTPRRVAKMYVEEVFQGLNPMNKPQAKLFENKYRYGQMLVERDITLHSYCEHHFVPIMGKAHVAYISSGKVIGLSKINRIVRYFAKRPQVQERLTEQIAAELKKVLETEDVAVIIDADHMCVSTRGVEDTASSTVTVHYSGKFKEGQQKQEFHNHINAKK